MHRVTRNPGVRPRTPLIALLALAGAATGALPAPAAEAAGPSLSRAERALERAVDRTRARHGLNRLRVNRRLSAAADAHCRDMLRADFFAHTSSDGRSMMARLRTYRPSSRLGETLAYLPAGQRRGAARTIVQMWLSSDAHRAVLLSPGFRRVGVARRVGRLGSQRVAVYTVDFASKH